jgi:hypothetical protein
MNSNDRSEGIKNLDKVWDKESSESPFKQLAKAVEELRFRDRKSMPPHARVKPVFREGTANEMTKTIIAFMQVIGGQGEWINSMCFFMSSLKLWRG